MHPHSFERANYERRLDLSDPAQGVSSLQELEVSS